MSNFNKQLYTTMESIHGKDLYYGTYNNKTSLYFLDNDVLTEIKVEDQDYHAMVLRIIMNIFLDQAVLTTTKVNNDTFIKQKLNDRFYNDYSQRHLMDISLDDDKYVIIKNETMTDIFMAKVLDNTTNNIYISLLSNDDKRRHNVHMLGDFSDKVFYIRKGSILTYINAEQKDDWLEKIKNTKKDIDIIRRKEADDVNELKKQIKITHKDSLKTREKLLLSLIDESNNLSLKM